MTTTREPPHGLVPCTRADFSLLCASDISLSWPAMQQPVPGLSVDSSLSCPLPAARPHLRQIARVSSCCRVTICTAPDVPDWARAWSNPSATHSSDQQVDRREHRRHSRAPGSALHFYTRSQEAIAASQSHRLSWLGPWRRQCPPMVCVSCVLQPVRRPRGPLGAGHGIISRRICSVVHLCVMFEAANLGTVLLDKRDTRESQWLQPQHPTSAVVTLEDLPRGLGPEADQ